MHYIHVLFLSVSLVTISSSMSAADTKKGVQFWYQAELGGPKSNRFWAQVSPSGTLGSLVKELTNNAELPAAFKVEMIFFGTGGSYSRSAKISTFEVDAPYTKDELSGARGEIILVLSVPKQFSSELLISGRDPLPSLFLPYVSKETIRGLIERYKKEAKLSDETGVIFQVRGGEIPEDRLVKDYAKDFIWGQVSALMGQMRGAQLRSFSGVPETPVTPSIIPSSSAMSSSMQPAAVIREVAPQWFEAKSKKTYFMDKYKKLEPLVGFNASDYDGYIEFKKDPLYDYLHDTIMSKMNESKSYIVIRAMLKNAASESSMDYQLLTKLVQPAIVRAIAALQKLCGKGRRTGFQFDEYDKNQLKTYSNSAQMDPLIARVSPGIDMTIYRFFYNVIGELDDVRIVKDSPLYKILDRFDNSLTELGAVLYV